MPEHDFKWVPPTKFNFAVDVVERWAESPDRLALIAVDEQGAEQRFSYAEVAQG